MTDCGCDKAKAELEEYLHRELSVTDSADVAEHMENCDDCSSEHLVGIALTLKVRQACQEKAPEELLEAVRLRLANA
ncbi:zf-HC2 domain-containing protein [Salinibacterium sp.]|uniref:zf-HC2 domain-containing protein n=1 Tax=Salinibacterium sp. TaxID=1915057 RepID=UPI00286B7BBE|nr:zf-HC2 domain-containing protein [Salinibacterium sp.]